MTNGSLSLLQSQMVPGKTILTTELTVGLDKVTIDLHNGWSPPSIQSSLSAHRPPQGALISRALPNQQLI